MHYSIILNTTNTYSIIFDYVVYNYFDIVEYKLFY